MTNKELKNLINKNIKAVDDKSMSLLESLVDATLEANENFNLTAIKDKESFRELMVYDSLMPLKYVELDENKTVLDIGTGAGFPGLPLAICSKAKYTLLDSTSKKIRHICCVIDDFGLKNATAISARAEDYIKQKRDQFDYVVARAVAPLNILLELCVPFVKVGGTFIAMKGAKSDEELDLAKSAIKKLDAEVISVNEEELPISKEKRTIILFRKLKPTNKKYPRQFNEIKSKPL